MDTHVEFEPRADGELPEPPGWVPVEEGRGDPAVAVVVVAQTC